MPSVLGQAVPLGPQLPKSLQHTERRSFSPVVRRTMWSRGLLTLPKTAVRGTALSLAEKEVSKYVPQIWSLPFLGLCTGTGWHPRARGSVSNADPPGTNGCPALLGIGLGPRSLYYL